MRTIGPEQGPLVVKIGGAALASSEVAANLARDVAALWSEGVPVVIVHGGGPAVSSLSRRLGLEPSFVEGLRVTDAETLEVARFVQRGSVALDLSAALARAGVRALTLAGADGGGWLRARPVRIPAGLGHVGAITSVDAGFLVGLLDAGLVPVISPLAAEERGLAPLNVNADTVAAAVAAALGAWRLVYLSDVDGIRDPEGRWHRRLRAADLAGWLHSGALSGGILPKARGALAALDAGVGEVHVAEGQRERPLLAVVDAAAWRRETLPRPHAAGAP